VPGGGGLPEELEEILPVLSKFKGGAVDTALVVGLEAVGLLFAPSTLMLSSVLTSLLAAFYIACKDMPGIGIGQKVAGGRVVDAKTGQAPEFIQVVGRNLPFAAAMVLAALPDPLGMGGLLIASLLLLGDVVLMLLIGRRVGDLLARTQVR